MQLGVPSDLFKGELVEFIFRVCCIIDQATFDQNFFGKTTLESSLSFCWIFLIHSQNHFCVFGMEMLPNQTFLSRLAVLMTILTSAWKRGVSYRTSLWSIVCKTTSECGKVVCQPKEMV